MMEMPNILCCLASPFLSVPLPRDMGMDYCLLRPPLKLCWLGLANRDTFSLGITLFIAAAPCSG